MKKKPKRILVVVGIVVGIVIVFVLVAPKKSTEGTSTNSDDVGACLYDDHCDLMAATEDQPALCESLGGTWQGPGSSCP